MEDDIDDKISDHPALLRMQQPFAKILSSTFGTNNADTERANDLLHGGSGDALNSALPEGTNSMGAFLKDMEESSVLFPRENIFRREELANQMPSESSNKSRFMKMYNRYGNLEEVRTSKAAMAIKVLEDTCVHEMLDDMMLCGHEICIRDIEKLRISMANEVENSRNRGGRKVVSNVVDIRTLLILCAQAVAVNDHTRARELLKQIKQHASETGDVTQRLAQCFAKGLEARLVGTGSQLWQLLKEERLSIVEFLKAHNLYMAACCFNKVVLDFSIMTVMKAMVGERKLHIVDYGMSYGFCRGMQIHSRVA
ncbi:scarecrow-like protein 14 [Panicum virgatum]|uniref:scarecrow-like protein 14 n=1 Tax=Panicum virgatum TaxID=38727 RepID=UPI0019D53FEA|nr:scarecrow-like protein 14 [Panicum virgatum]